MTLGTLKAISAGLPTKPGSCRGATSNKDIMRPGYQHDPRSGGHLMRAAVLMTVLVVPLLHTEAHGEIINVPADSTSIQAAIDGASPGDTVLVQENVYYERLNFLGKDVFLTSTYLYTGDTLSIQNTVIDADTGILGPADTACAVMFCNGETENAAVQGFTIQNGVGYKNEFDRWLGGAIMCIGSSPTIVHNIIRHNSAVHCGGGLCAIDSSRTVIDHNIFRHNTSGAGGAMLFSESSPVVTNNEIVNNLVDTTGYPEVMTMGGGICTYKCSSLIAHNAITENTAAIGGGICSYVLDTDSIADNVIAFNSAVGDSGFGGGISCFHTFSGTITGNAITDNTASSGGGIHLYLSNAIPEESAFISSNTIVRNTASGAGTGRGGGGITLLQFTNGSIEGNLLSHNTAPASGGGAIAFWQSTIPVTDNTMAFNSALSGGAVYANASGMGAVIVNLLNTICWADTGSVVGKELHNVGQASFNVTYSDIDGGYSGVGNIDCDPEFCYPDTGDYRLMEGSCCAGSGQGGVDIGAFGVGCDSVLISEDAGESLAPTRFLRNVPNPFSATTLISFGISSTCRVRLFVYDCVGRLVETILDEEVPAGHHDVTWEADGRDSGVYFLRIQTGNYSRTAKMLLVR